MTILPRLCFSAGSAARMTAAVPNRLTATTRSHSAAGTSPSAPHRSVPAAVTTASTPAGPLDQRADRVLGGAGVGEVGDGGERALGPVVDRHPVHEQGTAAGGGHRGGDGAPEAGRGAGDEHGADVPAGRAGRGAGVDGPCRPGR